jgi:hypothetical protein
VRVYRSKFALSPRILKANVRVSRPKFVWSTLTFKYRPKFVLSTLILRRLPVCTDQSSPTVVNSYFEAIVRVYRPKFAKSTLTL